ncbi:cytochrome c [Aliiroseovarius sp. S1339]|uniref:c-type cytochrome n=2 Tax=unclassified Aliiroseovarius TaxID=2623558 RepID=UPI0020C178F6|nr:cytochrome c [Aliiroseovarius sp. S1339]MCK8463083.1 cytochrome c [Aliiroseovarius sp. S1339]
MMRKYLILSAGLMCSIAAGAWLMTQAVAQTNDLSASVDLAQGEQYYQDYCASCHGANLEGQPDWRSPGPDGVLPAPPHDETGHTWHHPDSVLFDYTKLGGKAALAAQGVDFESGMPGFGDQLTDDQIWNILAYIKSTWPDRQRELQAGRSAADRQRQGN